MNNQRLPLQNTRVLIVGDSHTETGLNPMLFGNAQNISQAAEPYILTYWKLQKIFQSFKPDTLILGFAPHNISEFADLRFSNTSWSQEMFKRSYPLVSFDEMTSEVSVDRLAYVETLWNAFALYPKRDHCNYIGRFRENRSSDVSDWDSAISRHFYDEDGVEYDYSELSGSHLDSIIAFCNREGVTVVLISNPVHENYLDGIPSAIIEKYESLKWKHKEVIIIDKTRAVYPDSLFLNSDHLNFYGAERFTKEVIKILNTQNLI